MNGWWRLRELWHYPEMRVQSNYASWPSNRKEYTVDGTDQFGKSQRWMIRGNREFITTPGTLKAYWIWLWARAVYMQPFCCKGDMGRWRRSDNLYMRLATLFGYRWQTHVCEWLERKARECDDDEEEY